MGQGKVTSQEVAALAGVSQSAVSRVFTPGASASAKTAEKVRRAADQLGYRPNVLARAMVSGRSRIIGLVLAYLENQFYPVVLELLSNALQARGYHILIFTAPNSTDGIDGVMQDLMDYQVDGIIAASISMSSDLAARAQRAGIPVVLFNRGHEDAALSSVTTTNRAGGRRIAEFLLAGDHARIAHIAGWQGSLTGRDRREGFEAALAEAGRVPVAVRDGMYNRAVAMEETRALMHSAEPPDALFVGSDHMAFGVIDALRGMGIVPGQDVSVVGFDDVPQAAWEGYALTSYRQPVNRMVERAVNLILSQIESEDLGPEKIEIEGELILRGSARVPQGWTK